MKMKKSNNIIQKITVLFLIIFFTQKGFADTHYVDPSGGNISPYTTWGNAAHDIQDAVDSAVDGDLVLVRPGTYDHGGDSTWGNSNRVNISKNIIVESTGGPEVTIIKGQSSSDPDSEFGSSDYPDSARCAYIEGGTLSGFTLQDGRSRMPGGVGGAYVSGSDSLLTNCIVKNNNA